MTIHSLCFLICIWIMLGISDGISDLCHSYSIINFCRHLLWYVLHMMYHYLRWCLVSLHDSESGLWFGVMKWYIRFRYDAPFFLRRLRHSVKYILRRVCLRQVNRMSDMKPSLWGCSSHANTYIRAHEMVRFRLSCSSLISKTWQLLWMSPRSLVLCLSLFCGVCREHLTFVISVYSSLININTPLTGFYTKLFWETFALLSWRRRTQHVQNFYLFFCCFLFACCTIHLYINFFYMYTDLVSSSAPSNWITEFG